MRRPPSPTLAVDANILLGVVLGRRSTTFVQRVLPRRKVLTSSRAADEIGGVLLSRSLRSGPAAELTEQLLATLLVVDPSLYEDRITQAEAALRHAVPSRDGTVRDAHLLACAWQFDADLWTHDRDFAGTGWPSWSSANLLHALEAEARAEG